MTPLVWLATAGLVALSGGFDESIREAQKYMGVARDLSPQEVRAIGALSQRERLERAIRHLREARGEAASGEHTDLATRELASALNALAIEHARARDFRSAIGHGEEALGLVPKNPVLGTNLGEFYYASADYSNASRVWSKTMENAPDEASRMKAARMFVRAQTRECEAGNRGACDTAILTLQTLLASSETADLHAELGEAHYLKGETAEAVAAWNRATQMGGLPQHLQEKYMRVKASAHVKKARGFSSASSTHFAVEFEERMDPRLVDRFLGFLEYAHGKVGQRLGYLPTERIFVSLFAAQDYDRAGGIPWSAGAASQNRIDIRLRPGDTDQSYQDTALHEYTHYVVWRRAGQRNVPTWLTEGLAMTCEENLNRSYYSDFLRENLRQTGNYIPFGDLTSGFTGLTAGPMVRMAYAQSYDLTQLLIESFGLSTLTAALDNMASGQEFEAAISALTGKTMKDLEQMWVDRHGGRIAPAGGGAIDLR